MILIGIFKVSYLQMQCTKSLFHTVVKTLVKISRLYKESSGFFVKAVVRQRGANESPQASFPLPGQQEEGKAAARVNKPTLWDRHCCSRHPAGPNVDFNGRNPATHVWEEGAGSPLQPERRAELWLRL